VPKDQLDAEVDSRCRKIIKRSPTAIAIAKRSFNPTPIPSLAGALGMQALKLYYESEESKYGVRAFSEGRKPQFRKYVR
jgi:2-ketocyclohexanecarboxyl-CoA hydrolase